MCVFAVLNRILPECPLLILANREELRARPTASPQLWDVSPDCHGWLGGTDRQAGGTWLGLNAAGMVVSVTNRPTPQPDGLLRSRGLLCRDLLAYDSLEEAEGEATRQMQRHSFSGFNLLLLSRERSLVIEAGDAPRYKPLPAGIHAITNSSLNDPEDRRVRRVTRELQCAVTAAAPLDDAIEAAMAIFRLIDNGDSPAICQTGGEWGTVSSTLIALTDDPAEVRYFYAPGPPATTEYHDFSPLAKSLLLSKA